MVNTVTAIKTDTLKAARQIAKDYRAIGRTVRILRQTGTFQTCESRVSRSGAYTWTRFTVEVK